MAKFIHCISFVVACFAPLESIILPSIFFKSPELASFRKSLDAEMKRIKAIAAVLIHPKRAEPILEYEEEMLWKKGLLGSHSLQLCGIKKTHTLANTVKRLCEKGGIRGYKTNHSLRVTTATHLFQSGADEQLIME